MGRAGTHVSKIKQVPRTEDEALAWNRAAGRAEARNLCQWIRDVLNAECQRLGIKVGETLNERLHSDEAE